MLSTFHHAYNLRGDEGYFSYAYDNYPSAMEGYPDRVMYANLPERLRHETWFAQFVEAVGRYDLVWFDWGLHWMPEAYRRRFLAFHYNQAAAEDREVVVTNKDDSLSLDASVEDFEMGRPRTTREQAWTAELPVAETGGWGYVEDRTFYSAKFIIHTLVDIVSKSGTLLLSIGPRPDGTIERAERDRLLEIGAWLDVNGAAIYGTRPWAAFGEGPTRLEEGGDFVSDIEYTAEDVQYTRTEDGESVYAIVMGWPGEGTLTLSGTAVEDPSNAPSTPPGHGGSPPGRSHDDAGEHRERSTDDGHPGRGGSPGPGEVTLLGHGTRPPRRGRRGPPDDRRTGSPGGRAAERRRRGVRTLRLRPRTDGRRAPIARTGAAHPVARRRSALLGYSTRAPVDIMWTRASRSTDEGSATSTRLP